VFGLDEAALKIGVDRPGGWWEQFRQHEWSRRDFLFHWR